MKTDIYNTNKKYSVIYADPPWAYRNTATRAAASDHYPTMSREELSKMQSVVGGGSCRQLRFVNVDNLPDNQGCARLD